MAGNTYKTEELVPKTNSTFSFAAVSVINRENLQNLVVGGPYEEFCACVYTSDATANDVTKQS